MPKKFVDSSNLERLWSRITGRYDKKLDSVINKDMSIRVDSGREISVRVSSVDSNLLSLKQDGLYSARPVLNKLTLGDKVYDGTKDVNIPVYDGSYIIK